MTDVEPLIRTELESLMPLPGGSRRDWADVLERSGRRRRSRRRVLLALAIGVCVLAIAGAAIAAGLGAFSGVTMAQVRACDPSTVALTTASGARVLKGRTEAGVSCVAYEDINGGGGGTAGRLGESHPSGILAMKTKGVIVGLVPYGYDTLTLGSVHVPIVNQAFVVDPELALDPGTLSGPAGQITIDLSELAGQSVEPERTSQPAWVTEAVTSMRKAFVGNPKPVSVRYHQGRRSSSVTIRFRHPAICSGCTAPAGVALPRGRVATVSVDPRTHHALGFSVAP